MGLARALRARSPDGTPVLCLSTLAEHGRNLVRDPRASLVVGEADVAGDPLDSGRVTLAGALEAPHGRRAGRGPGRLRGTRPPPPALYGGFGDFTYYVLRVERVRWVGGYGRMDSTDAGDYHAAEPDPVAPGAAYAIKHLNEDHARRPARHGARARPATRTRPRRPCVRIDRYGLDLDVKTPRGFAETRIAFAEPANRPGRPARRHGRARPPRAR